MGFPFNFFTKPPNVWLLFTVLSLFLLTPSYGNDEIVSVGAIIDMSSRIGKEQHVAMEVAAQYYSNSLETYKLAISFYNVQEDPLKIASSAEDMIKTQKVKAIIGMQTWQDAALVANLGSQAKVPVLSFSGPAIAPPLMSARWPYLLSLANNDTAYTSCIADIIHAYGWKRIVAIYEDDANGVDYSIFSLLSDALQDFDSEIEQRLTLPPFSSLSDPARLVQEELIQLMQAQSRVFVILQLSSKMSTHLFAEARKLGLMDRDSAWIIPESVTNVLDSIDKSLKVSMEGALGIKTYYSESSNDYQGFQAEFRRVFRNKYPNENDSNPGFYALRAYDSIKIVAHALERIGNSSISPEILLKEMLSSNFNGLSGRIQFERGQLVINPIYRIVNVVGKSYNEIDFWTQEFGFIEKLSPDIEGKLVRNDNALIDRTENLGGLVIWPGKLVSRAPKGWNMPTKAKPLKIGVPGRTSFSRFVKVNYANNSSQENKYTGFCIEIFWEILKLLSYDVPYELEPFNGTYPDLVLSVYNKTYDAVVGDMTILSERLQYVDFTVPYAESGLTMIVPEKSENTALMFLRPFTWKMWLVTGCILIYTVFVVWYLEHNDNPDFSGPLLNQISTALWFTFSSLYFAHREKVVSNLSRVVIAVWLFLVLILNSSYTASLSSMLTVQQLQPNVTDIEWLKRMNSKIGCDGDSFVRTYMENVLEFKPENIMNISSEYSYPDEFQDRHIVAAFLELPYGKVYINKYCKGYSASTPTNRFGGLGFMFQKGSPMTKDFSKAILDLSQNGVLKKLEDEWLNPPNDCSANVSSGDTQSLDVTSFWVLYLFSGATSTLCVLVSTIRYCRALQTQRTESEETTIGKGTTTERSMWKRIHVLTEHVCNFRKQSSKESTASTPNQLQDVTDCSSRWENVSSSGTPDHYGQDSQVANVSPQIQIPITYHSEQI